jgi:formylmethanofuran dehydrogenase subunit C
MKKIVLLLVLLVSQFISAQEITKNIGDFSTVKVYDRISVQLIPASENKVVITGDAREEVELVNKNGDLKIRMALKKLLKGDTVEATVYYKNLEGIEASEGSFVGCDAVLNSTNFVLNSKEGSEIKVKLDVNKASIKATSGGKIIISGVTDNQEIIVNSGAIVEAKDFKLQLVLMREEKRMYMPPIL